MTTTAERRRSAPSRAIDPRVLARRAGVARQAGRRRVQGVALLALLGSILVAGIAVSNSTLLDIEVVEVVGAERADEGQIITATAIELGEPLAELDRAAAAAAVRDVPWVDDATVERHWNGSVTVAVTEREAVIAIPTGSRFVLVDTTGRQLELVDIRPGSFLPVSGIEASGVPGDPAPEATLVAIDLLAVLAPPVSDEVEGVVVGEDGLVLELSSGAVAALGDGRELPEKLLALETVLDQVDLACLASVDVAVPTAPTVRRTRPLLTGEEPEVNGGGC